MGGRSTQLGQLIGMLDWWEIDGVDLIAGGPPSLTQTIGDYLNCLAGPTKRVVSTLGQYLLPYASSRHGLI